MAVYGKKFADNSEYEQFTGSTEILKPAVYYTKNENEVHLFPHVPETRLVVTYDVTSTTNDTILYIEMYSGNFAKSMEIDGEPIEGTVNSYRFDTLGEHVVKYELLNPTTLKSYFFSNSGNTINVLKVQIPDSVIEIGDNAFYSNHLLSSITFSNNLATIGSGCFNYCRQLTAVTLPDSLTTLHNCFPNCGIDAISIPKRVNSIIGRPFANCDITSVTVSEENTTYHSNGNCIIETATNKLVYGINTSVIPNNITSIGNNAFENCYGLKSASIPSGVTSIGDYAFASCSGLTSVTFESGSLLTIIGKYAFQSCSKLTTIEFPNSLTSLGQFAMYNAELSSVTFGTGITEINNGAFAGMTSLTRVTINATTPPSLGSAPDPFVGISNYTIYVPSGSVDAYKAAWPSKESLIQPIS